MPRLLLLLLFATTAFAQGVHYTNNAITESGQIVPYPTVRACSEPATGSTCTPLANLFTDRALTQPLGNPFTGDVLGNFGFYVAAGRYHLQVSGMGIATYDIPDIPLLSLDSNNTWTGLINNMCIPFLVTDIGAAMNTCLARGNGVDIWIPPNLCGNTVTTPVVVNLNYWSIHGSGSGSGCTLNNGITGVAAEPMIKITGTSSYGLIEKLNVNCNGLTGASGNGNGISIIGTGPSPAVIRLNNVGANFCKGTGKDGTGASITANGLYVYKSIDIFVDGGSWQGNAGYAHYFDNGTNNSSIKNTVVNSNTTGAFRASGGGGAEHIIYGPNNDVEANGVNAGDIYIYLDGLSDTHIVDNWMEANNGEIVFFSAVAHGQVEFSGNLVSVGSSNNANEFLSTGSGSALNAHDNQFVTAKNLTACIAVNGGTQANANQITHNMFRMLVPATSVANCILSVNGPTVYGLLADNNQFGSPTSSSLWAGTSAILFQNCAGCAARNNVVFVAGGTLTNGVQVTSTSTNTSLQTNSFLTGPGGAITNKYNISSQTTNCVGDGCTGGMDVGSPGLGIRGATSGITLLSAAAAAGGTASFPNNTGTVAELNFAQSFTADQTFGTTIISGTTGLITKYNNVNTAGMGVAPILATVSLTNQSATIPATNLIALPAAGTYRLTGIVWTNTVGGGGSAAISYTFNNGNGGGAITNTCGGTQTLTSLTSTTSTCHAVFHSAASQPIQYTVTYVAAGSYNVDLQLERLQ